MSDEFPGWGKTPRIGQLFLTITEKLDGTNGLIQVGTDGQVRAGSRNRWLAPASAGDKHADNFGFAAWVATHAEALRALGHGNHYGEWYGQGIGRGYGIVGKRFALFNSHRPKETLPVVPGLEQAPILYTGKADLAELDAAMARLQAEGSVAVPGWMQPEGIIAWFGDRRYKLTFDGPKHGQGSVA